MRATLDNMSVVVVLATTIAVMAVLPPAAALRCFQCNSHTDPNCLDLKANDSASNVYLKECDDPVTATDAEPFCRKIVQTILAEGDRRVIRRCGYEQGPKPCTHFDDDDHAEVVCQCFEEGCNSAPSLGRGALVQSLVASAVSLLLMLLTR